MKYYGSILEFSDDRAFDLLRAFRAQVDAASYIRMPDIVLKTVNSPSKRFWVSEERAAIVVADMMRGRDPLAAMIPTKREMFTELHKRILDLKQQHPDWPMVVLATVAVNSPAPKFYMAPSVAMRLLAKLRKGTYEKRNR